VRRNIPCATRHPVSSKSRLAAVQTFRDAGIVVNSTPGLRIGLVIVDHAGYIFTSIALYLEAEDGLGESRAMV
jgi:hypothetical protein